MNAMQVARQLRITSAFVCSKADAPLQSFVKRGIECLGFMQQHSEMYSSHIQLDLRTLLQETRNMSVTDPRDRMFALANVTGDGESPTFRPDYALSTAEVTKRYARYILQKEPNAVGLSSVLYDCDWDESIPVSQKLELPSWVPDWHRPLTGAHVSWQVKRSSASGGLRADIPAISTHDQTILGIRNFSMLAMRHLLAWCLDRHSSSGNEEAIAAFRKLL